MRSMKTKTTLLVLLLGVCAWQCAAQPPFDSSGVGLLNGAYYMRQVFYIVSGNGALVETINVQGMITFSGTGTYSFTGSVLDSAVTYLTAAGPLTATGTYVISGSGEGYITPLYQIFPNDSIVGLVSHGVFIGSTPGGTSGFNDLF